MLPRLSADRQTGRRGRRVVDRRAALAGSAGSACAGFLAGCSDSGQPSSSARRSPRSRASSSRSGALGDPAILAGLSAERGNGWPPAAARSRSRSSRSPAPDQLSEVDLLIFPGQELGTLVDADALETIPNEAVLPVRPADDEARARDELRGEGGGACRRVPVHGHRAGVSRAGEQVRHRPHGAAAGRVGPGPGLPARRVLPAGQSRRRRARPGSRWSHPRPGPSSMPWPGSSRAGTGTATGRPITGSRRCWDRTREGLGDATYLARAASLGQHRDQFSFLFDADSMAPRIDSPPVRRGPPRGDRLEGLGAARHGGLRRGRAPARRFARARWPC